MIRELVTTLALLALCAPATLARGHDVDCADVKASQVSAMVNYSGTPKTCGVGIVIFGVGGSIVGEKCYPLVTTTPAHQECMGEPNEGTRCVLEGTLEVKAKQCECGGLVVPFIKIGIPAVCACTDTTGGGTVEDFETMTCAGV